MKLQVLTRCTRGYWVNRRPTVCLFPTPGWLNRRHAIEGSCVLLFNGERIDGEGNDEGSAGHIPTLGRGEVCWDVDEGAENEVGEVIEESGVGGAHCGACLEGARGLVACSRPMRRRPLFWLQRDLQSGWQGPTDGLGGRDG